MNASRRLLKIKHDLEFFEARLETHQESITALQADMERTEQELQPWSREIDDVLDAEVEYLKSLGVTI